MKKNIRALFFGVVCVAVAAAGVLLINHNATRQISIRWAMHNTETVGTMIEGYRREHGGQYPPSLDDPEVLKHADAMDKFVAHSNAVYQVPQDITTEAAVFQFKTPHGTSELRTDGAVVWLKESS